MLVSCSPIFMPMRTLLPLSLFFTLLWSSCSSDHVYDNPNLLDVKVDLTVNLSLPQFSPLEFTMQPVYIRDYGNGGVIITKTGPNSYAAFDAHDPNIPYAEDGCGILQINGLEGVSTCAKKNTYNLISGTAVESKSEGEDLEFALKPYEVIEMGGGLLRIKN